MGLESARGGSGENRKEYFWVLLPSLLASAVATVVFVLLSGAFFETLYVFPDYSPRMVDMVIAAPFGMLGGVIGVLFMFSLRSLQRLFQPLKERLVLRGLIGGLGMGSSALCGRSRCSRARPVFRLRSALPPPWQARSSPL